MARQVLTIAGAVVGSFFGMPQLGFALGSLIGNAVDPVQIQGPKIGDLAVQTSRDGVPRPIVFGVAAVAGNIIDRSEPVIKKKKERQGKGGPETVTEHVYMSYAIRICEGPITSVSRVWENEKLVYDTTPGTTIAADSTKFLEKVTFYLGGESQLPDPTLEAIHGVGSTPAHRGTAYAVWNNKDLTDFGGAIPQYRFEVNGLASSVDTTTGDVVFLLHFDGAEGSKVYTDETGKSWSGSPNAYITQDAKKYGTGSLYSSGGSFNPTYISCLDPYFSNNAIGTQDFCLEIYAWIGSTYTTTGGNRAICGFRSGPYAFGLYHNKDAGTNGRFSGAIADSGGTEIFGNTTYPNKEQWYHVAMTRSGNTLRLFVDGVSQGTATVTGLSIAAEDTFYIGDLQTVSPPDSYIPFLGRLDEARLTVGDARYTANFTPPTAQFPNP